MIFMIALISKKQFKSAQSFNQINQQF